MNGPVRNAKISERLGHPDRASLQLGHGVPTVDTGTALGAPDEKPVTSMRHGVSAVDAWKGGTGKTLFAFLQLGHDVSAVDTPLPLPE